MINSEVQYSDSCNNGIQFSHAAQLRHNQALAR